jgi:hypothetical protein
MVVRILIGVVVGGVIGLGANYVCILAGGTCPLMNNKIVAIVLWALLGGIIGAVTSSK